MKDIKIHKYQEQGNSAKTIPDRSTLINMRCKKLFNIFSRIEVLKFNESVFELLKDLNYATEDYPPKGYELKTIDGLCVAYFGDRILVLPEGGIAIVRKNLYDRLFKE
jgi:hypothetical protein